MSVYVLALRLMIGNGSLTIRAIPGEAQSRNLTDGRPWGSLRHDRLHMRQCNAKLGAPDSRLWGQKWKRPGQFER